MRARLLIPILFQFYFIRLRDTDRYSIAWRRQTLRGRTRTCGTASARAAVKDMDLQALHGRKVALYIATMGDQGSGSLTGVATPLMH